MELTYIPYEHPPAPFMTPAEILAWQEPAPPEPMTMEQRAYFHGVSVESYEQIMLRAEEPLYL